MTTPPNASPATDRRVRKRRNPAWPIIAATVVIGSGLALIAIPGTISVPTAQIEVAMPGMSPHLLSLWFDDAESASDAMETIGQLVDVGGDPVAATAMGFSVIDAQEKQFSSVAGEALPNTNRADSWRFRAVVSTPSVGVWGLDVEIQMSGRSTTVRVPVQTR